MDTPSCPICQATDCLLVYDLSRLTGPCSIAGRVLTCRQCRMWFKEPSRRERVNEVYQGEYPNDEAVERYMLGESTRAFFRRALECIELPPSGGTKPRLLDIGTGRGALLEEAQKMGFDAQGIDPSGPFVEMGRARGLRVEQRAAEELEDGTEPFDVVTLMDVIEHTQNPMRSLTAARRLLKPHGELLLFTPNHRGVVVMVARLLARLGLEFAVREIYGTTHLCFFDDRSLPMALDKAGLAIRRLDLLPYDPSRPGQAMSRLSLSVVAAIDRLGRPFDKTFRMLVYARNRNDGVRSDGSPQT